jgi:hypothetical protein
MSDEDVRSLDPTRGRAEPIPSPKVGWFGRLLAGFANYDLKLLAKIGGDDFEHERKKLVRVGTSVLIPAIMAFFSAYYFSGAYFADVQTRLLIAITASLTILLLDCIIVATLSKQSVGGTLARVAISAVMGYVLSDPIALAFYRETIDARNIAELNTERQQRETTLRSDLATYDAEWNDVQRHMAQAQEQLEHYSPERLRRRHADEAAARETQRLATIRERQDAEAMRLAASRAGLEAQRTQKQADLRRKLLEMQHEDGGVAESGKEGQGPIYKQLQAEFKVLMQEFNAINARLQDIDRQRDPLLGDRSPAHDINALLGEETHEPQPDEPYELTPEEQAAKQRLETAVSEYRLTLKSIGDRTQALRAEIGRLPQDYALSTRDDSLTQTRVLSEILADNPLMRAKVAALLLLFFLIDVTPVIVKLTVRTPYDDYVRSIARDRLLKSESAREAFHKSTFDTGIARGQRVNALCTQLIQDVSAIAPANSAAVRVAQAKATRTRIREFDETVERAAATQPLESGQTTGIFSLLFATIKNAFLLLRAKFST